MLWTEQSIMGLIQGLTANKMQLPAEHIPYFPAHKTHFFPEKCDLNLTCVLCVEGKYYLQTYKYPYIYYTTSLS